MIFLIEYCFAYRVWLNLCALLPCVCLVLTDKHTQRLAYNYVFCRRNSVAGTYIYFVIVIKLLGCANINDCSISTQFILFVKGLCWYVDVEHSEINILHSHAG